MCSSFDAVAITILKIFQYLITFFNELIGNYDNNDNINNKLNLTIISDSLSTISALEKETLYNNNIFIQNIWRNMITIIKNNLFDNINLCFTYSHCDVYYNEYIDNIINLFSKYQKNINNDNNKYLYNGMKVGITLNSIKAHIKLLLNEKYNNNIINDSKEKLRSRYKLLKTKPTSLKDFNDKNYNRLQQITLARIRVDADIKIGKLYHLINKTNKKCRWCKSKHETILHLFNECTNNHICVFRNLLISHYGNNPSVALTDFKNTNYAIDFIQNILSIKLDN